MAQLAPASVPEGQRGAYLAELGGIGLQAGATLGKGMAERRAASYEARLARYQAEQERRRGEFEAMKAGWQSAQVAGRARAIMAAQGVSLASGTPATISAQTAALGSMEQQTIRDNAALEAYGYEQKAKQLKAAGKMSQMEGLLGAAGQLLGGVGKLHKTYEA